MAVDQGKVVVQARVQRPDPTRWVAGAVVAVEELPEARNGPVEVAAHRAVQVGCARERREVPDVASDTARDVGFGSPRETIDPVHPANHADVSQQIALEVGEGIPVAQNLRTIGAAPHEIGGLEFLGQQLRARSGQGEGRLSAIVAADEVHTVDAGDGRHVEAQSHEQRGQRRRMAEVVRQVGQPWFSGHAVVLEPALSVGVVAQDGLGVGQDRIGRGDASARQAQAALVDQAAQPFVLGRVGLPVALQEEQALDGEDPARLLFEGQENPFKDARNTEFVVLLGGVQPVGIPVTGFAENKYAACVWGNSQPGAKPSLLGAGSCCGVHADW